MARLFTTHRRPDNIDEDNFEIVLDVPNNSSQPESSTMKVEAASKEKENAKIDKNTNSNKMSTIKTKLVGLNKQKLTNGTWHNLLALPPQELVSELKVPKIILNFCLFIIILIF